LIIEKVVSTLLPIVRQELVAAKLKQVEHLPPETAALPGVN
jgi:hypothetical protein